MQQKILLTVSVKSYSVAATGQGSTRIDKDNTFTLKAEPFPF